MSGKPPELLTVSLPLGPLTSAFEAQEDVFHLQDPKTKELKAYPLDPQRKQARASLFKQLSTVLVKQITMKLAGIIKISSYALLTGLTLYLLLLNQGSMRLGVLSVDSIKHRIHSLTVPENSINLQSSVTPAVAPTQYPMPVPMTVLSEISTKPAQGLDTKDVVTKAKDTRTTQKDEPLIVLNEVIEEGDRKKPEANHSKSDKKTDSSAPSSPPTLKKSANSYSPQLVAIQDESTILVTSPSSRIPQKVSIGNKLPDGRRVDKIDVSNGVVTLEGGSSIRLE